VSAPVGAGGGGGGEEEEELDDELELELEEALEGALLQGLAPCRANMSATSWTREARQWPRLSGAILERISFSICSLSSWVAAGCCMLLVICAMAARIVTALARAAALDTEASLM